MFYLTTHSTHFIYGYVASDMAKYHTDIERGNLLPPHGLPFPNSSKGFTYMHHPTDRITHTTAFVIPVVEHWLERQNRGMHFNTGGTKTTGIRGNERADSPAKSALDLPHAKVGLPYNDFKHCISLYILSIWQDDWNGAVANRLHSVKPDLGDWQFSYRRCRKDEVVLCRTRISHIS